MRDIYERAQKRRTEIEGAVDPASAETKNSGLPGNHNGPGDAYMNSDAYLRTWDPDYEAMHTLVGRWHEHFYGNGPVLRDARGRINPVRPIPPNRGGEVRVRAHDRAGGKVAVRSYERARPGA